MARDNLEYKKVLTNVKIVRKQLHDKVKQKIEEDEKRSLVSSKIEWSSIGSIERQCDLLERLLNELSND